MKKLCFVAIALISIFLCAGCMQSEEQITIRPDGSGEVVIRAHMDEKPSSVIDPVTMQSMFFIGENSDLLHYPPRTQISAEYLFPPAVFSAVKCEKKTEGGQEWFVTSATFKNPDDLQQSPYANLHSIQISREGGKLTVRGVAAPPAMAYLYEIAGKEKNGQLSAFLPFMSNIDFKKSRATAKIRITVTLPSDVTAESGVAQGQTATFEADGSKNGEQFGQKLMNAWSARCADTGISFTTTPPVRPGLFALDQYKEGPTQTARKVNPEEVRKSALARPAALSIQRSFDFSGSGGSPRDQMVLYFCVDLPASLNAFSLGKLSLAEATDDTGANLLMSNDHYYRSNSQRYQPNNNSKEKLPATTVRFIDTTLLRPPAPEAKSIRVIKGEYKVVFAESRLVVLKNAIQTPEKKDEKKTSTQRIQNTNDIENDTLSTPELEKHNIRISMRPLQNNGAKGITEFSLYFTQNGNNDTGSPSFGECAVYDASGKPIPFFLRAMDSRRNGNIQFSADAVRPLSIVMLINIPSSETSVAVPLELKDIPIFPPKEPEAEGSAE